MIAVGSGALGLSPAGAARRRASPDRRHLEKFLPALGLERVAQAAAEQSRRRALDRLVPGLGNLARQNAGAGVAAGVSLHRPADRARRQEAVALPLRFDDGAVSLGPLPIGETPPLF